MFDWDERVSMVTAMKEAIRILWKRRPEDDREGHELYKYPKTARLNNLCLSRIRADSVFKNKILSKRPLVNAEGKVTAVITVRSK